MGTFLETKRSHPYQKYTEVSNTPVVSLLVVYKHDKTYKTNCKYRVYLFILVDTCDSFLCPPTIVEGHYVFWSVRPFVRASVRSFDRASISLQVKVFGQGSFFYEFEVQST